MSRRTRPAHKGQRKGGQGCGPNGRQGLRTLNAIVSEYRARWARRCEDELVWYREQASLEDAIREAGMARLSCGKRHPHQYRIPAEALREAAKALLGARLSRPLTFDQLHSLVNGAIGPISGIGELMVYDTSHRIGAYRGIEPERVYLHAGTRVGARALGLRTAGRAYLEVADLPPELRRLTPAQVEDCLCIFKEDLADVAPR